MRVGILHGYGLRGSGSAIYVNDLSCALARNGHSVHVICHELKPQLIDDFDVSSHDATGTRSAQRLRDGVRWIHGVACNPIPVSYPRPELENWQCVTDMSSEARDTYVAHMVDVIASIHKHEPLDALLVQHLSLLTQVAAAVRSRLGIPFSVVVHGTGLAYATTRDVNLFSRVESAVESANAIIALNPSVRARVLAAFPGVRPPVIQIPPGIDLETFTPADGDPEIPIVGYAGRLSLDKGLHCLLRAWPDVQRRHPKARLRIAGGGPDEADLKAMASALARGDEGQFMQVAQSAAARRAPDLARTLMAPLRAHRKALQRVSDLNIDWLGPLGRQGVADHFRTACVCPIPSLVPEAFPLVCFEALACGSVPIGTDEAGLGWVLSHAEQNLPQLSNHLRVSKEPDDFVNVFAERIHLQLSGTSSAYCRSGHVKRFLTRYDWHAIAEKLLDISANSRLVGTTTTTTDSSSATWRATQG